MVNIKLIECSLCIFWQTPRKASASVTACRADAQGQQVLCQKLISGIRTVVACRTMICETYAKHISHEWYEAILSHKYFSCHNVEAAISFWKSDFINPLFIWHHKRCRIIKILANVLFLYFIYKLFINPVQYSLCATIRKKKKRYYNVSYATYCYKQHSISGSKEVRVLIWPCLVQ